MLVRQPDDVPGSAGPAERVVGEQLADDLLAGRADARGLPLGSRLGTASPLRNCRAWDVGPVTLRYRIWRITAPGRRKAD
jgi:hypothetical protein